MSKDFFKAAILEAMLNGNVEISDERDGRDDRDGDRGDGYSDKRLKILPEAAEMRLREAAERYAGPNPYKVGDIVTPRPDCNIKGHGRPHIVVEAVEKPTAAPDGEDVDGACTFSGGRLNLRVLVLVNDRVVPFWVEAWQFETWKSS